MTTFEACASPAVKDSFLIFLFCTSIIIFFFLGGGGGGLAKSWTMPHYRAWIPTSLARMDKNYTSTT